MAIHIRKISFDGSSADNLQTKIDNFLSTITNKTILEAKLLKNYNNDLFVYITYSDEIPIISYGIKLFQENRFNYDLESKINEWLITKSNTITVYNIEIISLGLRTALIFYTNETIDGYYLCKRFGIKSIDIQTDLTNYLSEFTYNPINMKFDAIIETNNILYSLFIINIL